MLNSLAINVDVIKNSAKAIEQAVIALKKNTDLTASDFAKHTGKLELIINMTMRPHKSMIPSLHPVLYPLNKEERRKNPACLKTTTKTKIRIKEIQTFRKFQPY
ncbi:hypothetical protein LSTR_LSTR006990 [Laodelphax striatellus]|uniref:Uncharacterized protein n=1 Tax=Laodelphax striatellus TaxID=195883 RepID=A0A482WK35_LAOST|nr:hypothetical protein LSTR_LSTR006990 [Laodelphax striatellus]